MTAIATPKPGVYRMPGRLHGEECLVAFDRDGEFQFEVGPSAYGCLITWLEDRGVSSPPRPLLTVIHGQVPSPSVR